MTNLKAYKKIKERTCKTRFTPLTCIIGANCAEGTAIIADSRITREFEATVESKFHVFWDGLVIAACAGKCAVIDRFRDELEKKASKIQPSSFMETYEMVEDAITKVKSRYVPKLGKEHCDIEVLIGCLEKFDTGEPILKVVDRCAVTEDVKKTRIIGHGKEYATTLFRLMFSNMLTLRETGLLGSFVISAISSMGLDQTVGVDYLGPQVVIIKPDEKPQFLNTMEKDFRRTNENAKSQSFRNKLVLPVWGTIPQAYSGQDVT